MSENYIVINGKKAELTEEQLKQLGIELPPENNRWRATKGQKYYRVNTFNQISSLRECYCADDDWCYYSHNYFKTKEDAEKYARVLETEMLLRKYADEHNEPMPWDTSKHWTILYNAIDYRIEIESWVCFMMPQIVYFSSEKIARDALEEIGEERIKEYLTYEW